MDAIRSKPYQPAEAQPRKPLTQATAVEKLGTVSSSPKEKPAAKQPEAVQAKAYAQTPRPTTNTRGEKLGQVFNATA